MLDILVIIDETLRMLAHDPRIVHKHTASDNQQINFILTQASRCQVNKFLGHVHIQ